MSKEKGVASYPLWRGLVVITPSGENVIQTFRCRTCGLLLTDYGFIDSLSFLDNFRGLCCLGSAGRNVTENFSGCWVSCNAGLPLIDLRRVE